MQCVLKFKININRGLQKTPQTIKFIGKASYRENNKPQSEKRRN
jgi:hypothetical protein